MFVRFGNMNVRQFEEEVGVKFNKEDYDFLKNHRSDNAQPSSDKFHIFRHPLAISVGHEISDELVTILKKYNSEYKRRFEITW